MKICRSSTVHLTELPSDMRYHPLLTEIGIQRLPDDQPLSYDQLKSYASELYAINVKDIEERLNYYEREICPLTSDLDSKKVWTGVIERTRKGLREIKLAHENFLKAEIWIGLEPASRAWLAEEWLALNQCAWIVEYYTRENQDNMDIPLDIRTRTNNEINDRRMMMYDFGRKIAAYVR